MTNDQLYRNQLEKPIESCKVSKEDLRELCLLLREMNNQAAELEVHKYKQLDQSDKEYKQNKEILRKSFDLNVKIKGKNGEELFGNIEDVFDSPSFPNKVESLYLNSANTLQTNHNYHPRNKFDLILIFTKPSIFDFSIEPSDPTPNYNRFNVEGYDTTWVNGVYREVEKFFDEHSSSFNFIHQQSVYDLYIWVLGIPFCFWVISKLSNTVDSIFSNFNNFVNIAAYVYVFFFSLIGLRILFHYARWIWPLIEYENGKAKEKKHRGTIFLIFITIVGTVLYDLVKNLLL